MIDRSAQRRRRAVAVLVLATLLLPAVVPATGRAAVAGCTVRVSGSAVVHRSLQAAVDAARAGRTLSVRGTCTGITTIDKRLTVAGTQKLRRSTLDGALAGSTVTIDATGVRLRNLTIRSGNGTEGGGGREGGNILVSPGATLDLVNVRVLGGSATNGGGIHAGLGSTLRLLEGTVVEQGAATALGGGIFSRGSVVVTGRSRISGASAGESGGGVMMAVGTLTVSGNAVIRTNTLTTANSPGGGIAASSATIVIGGSARVTGNAAAFGGGIFLYQSSLAIRTNAMVALNTATGNGVSPSDGGGGGVAAAASSVAISGDATIERNTVAGGGLGGGLRLRLGSSLAVDDIVSICADARVADHIRDNTPDDCAAS